MRLICPSCGAIASAEAWANDAAWRQCLIVIIELPSAVQQRVLPYLGLFRQGQRGLSSARALRLLKDLSNLVVRGNVQWEGGEERPAGPMLWAEALDAVLARRPAALENHNYLRRVAWEMAKGGAARNETRRELDRQAKSGAHASVGVGIGIGVAIDTDTESDTDTDHSEQPATLEDLAAVKAALRGFLDKS